MCQISTETVKVLHEQRKSQVEISKVVKYFRCAVQSTVYIFTETWSHLLKQDKNEHKTCDNETLGQKSNTIIC